MPDRCAEREEQVSIALRLGRLRFSVALLGLFFLELLLGEDALVEQGLGVAEGLDGVGVHRAAAGARGRAFLGWCAPTGVVRASRSLVDG